MLKSAKTLTATLACALLCGCLFSCAQTQTQDPASLDAFGESYTQASEAIAERVDDPTLLAIRSDETTYGEAPRWTYLYGSQENSFMYTVEDGDEGYQASTYGRLEWPANSWESVPDPSEVIVGAQEALEKVREIHASEGPIENYQINLVLFLSGDGTVDASTNPMHWEVIVNAADDAAAETTDEAAGEDAADTTATETPSGTCYTVDAITGDVAQKVVADDNAEDEDAELPSNLAQRQAEQAA